MAATTTHQAAPHTSTATPSTPRHIFDLPQELQDIIFGFAYAKAPGTKLVADQSQQPKSLFPTPAELKIGRATRSPRLKVNEWLVSKKWFVAAARAYVEDHVIPMGIAEDRVGLLTGVLHAFGTSFSTTAPYTHFLLSQMYPRLRRLELRLNRFDGWETTNEMKILPATNDRIVTMGVFKRLLEIRGLQEIRVVSDGTYHDGRLSAAEKVVFESNLRQFEDLIKSRYGRESTDLETPAPETPWLGPWLGTPWRSWEGMRMEVALYPGSEVCKDSSQSVSAVVRRAAASDYDNRSLLFATTV